MLLVQRSSLNLIRRGYIRIEHEFFLESFCSHVLKSFMFFFSLCPKPKKSIVFTKDFDSNSILSRLFKFYFFLSVFPFLTFFNLWFLCFISFKVFFDQNFHVFQQKELGPSAKTRVPKMWKKGLPKLSPLQAKWVGR